MPQLTIPQMCDRMADAPKREALRAELVAMSRNPATRDYFNDLCEAVANTDGQGLIPTAELERIQSDLSVEYIQQAKYELLGNTANAIGALGRIVGSEQIQQIAKHSSLILEASTHFRTLQQCNQAFGQDGVLSAVQKGAALNSAFALGTIAAQIIMSHLIKTGPSFEQVMLESIQKIYEKIDELHQDMLEQFREINNAIADLRKLLVIGIQSLNYVICDEVSGLKVQAIPRLDQIINTMNVRLQHLDVGIRNIYLQALKEYVGQVIGLENGDEANGLRATVHAINTQLFQSWIMSGSNAENLTGISLFPSYQIDDDSKIKLLPIDKDSLKHSIAFMLKLAKEICGQEDLNISRINLGEISHPEVFRIAAQHFIKLYGRFPAQINDPNCERLNLINARADITIDACHAIQRSNVLFAKLFDEYMAALSKVADVIKDHVETKNERFRFDFGVSNQNFALNKALNDIIKATPATDKQVVRRSFDRRDQIGDNCYQFNMTSGQIRSVLPAELFLASTLGLGTLSATYHAEQTYRWGEERPTHLLGLECLFRDSRQKADHERVHVNIILDPIFNDATANPSLFKAQYFFQAEITAREFKTISTHSMHEVANKCLHYRSHVEDPAKEAIGMLRRKIQTRLNVLRDEYVIKPLKNGDIGPFNAALSELDLAKRKLMAFALFAGFPMGEPNSIGHNINALTEGKDVKNKLMIFSPNQLMLAANNPTFLHSQVPTFWQKPDLLAIQQLKQSVLEAIAQPDNGFVSDLIAQLIMTQANVLASKQLFLANLHRPTHQLTPLERFASLDLNAYPADQPDLLLLIRSLQQENIVQIIRRMIPVNKTESILTGRLSAKSISIIHLVAYTNNQQALEALLDKMRHLEPQQKAAILNFEDLNGKTPLMYAVMAGNLAAVNTLLVHGVNKNATDDFGNSALNLAAELGLEEIYIAIDAFVPQQQGQVFRM